MIETPTVRLMQDQEDLPRMRPDKTELIDQLPDEDHYMLVPGDPTPTPTMQCLVCGTRLRPGQPHSALKPEPHQTIAPLIVPESLDPEEHQTGIFLT